MTRLRRRWQRPRSRTPRAAATSRTSRSRRRRSPTPTSRTSSRLGLSPQQSSARVSRRPAPPPASASRPLSRAGGAVRGAPGSRPEVVGARVTDPILRVEGLNKAFGAVHVLHDVEFAVYPGEVTALVGDNGAGKSTLVKCIAGINSIDTGQMFWEGEPITIASPSVASSLGIEFVYQDLALADNLDITQNMFLGREIRRGPFLQDPEMETKARETLQSLAVRTINSVRQPVSSLSGGQRQTVAIARSVLWNGKVVFLDEPTAALGVAQTRQLLNLVRRLADNGIGVVLISHNMNDVMEVADRVAALYLGRIAAEVLTKDSSTTQIVELITAGRSGDIGLAPATANESI